MKLVCVKAFKYAKSSTDFDWFLIKKVVQESIVSYLYERSLIRKGYKTYFLSISQQSSRVPTDKTYFNCPNWVTLPRLCHTHCAGNSSSVSHNSSALSFLLCLFRLKACRYWRYVLVIQYATLFSPAWEIMCNVMACWGQPVTIGESARSVITQLIDIWHWHTCWIPNLFT